MFSSDCFCVLFTVFGIAWSLTWTDYAGRWAQVTPQHTLLWLRSQTSWEIWTCLTRIFMKQSKELFKEKIRLYRGKWDGEHRDVLLLTFACVELFLFFSGCDRIETVARERIILLSLFLHLYCGSVCFIFILVVFFSSLFAIRNTKIGCLLCDH